MHKIWKPILLTVFTDPVYIFLCTLLKFFGTGQSYSRISSSDSNVSRTELSPMYFNDNEVKHFFHRTIYFNIKN